MGTTTSPVRAEAPGRQFPMAQTIDEALPLLRRPFSPSVVRAKVQNQDRVKPPNWGQIARYIDARLVTERLNLVAGGSWRYEYAPLDRALWPAPDKDDEHPPLFVSCSLTVFGQCHTDVGEGRDPKAAFSDALKRAAVPFGIGRSIYAVPRRFLFAEESKRPPRDKLKRRGERLYLTDANEALLRDEYEQWLAEVGIAAFGEPLEHGPDQAEAVEETDETEDAVGTVANVGENAPAGGLRAVSDGSPQEPPATIHERRRLMTLIAAAGYKEQTVMELAALTLGERLLDRLSRKQMGELERMVSAASSGAVNDATLAKRVKSATEQSGGGEAVRRGLDALVRDGGQGDRRRAA